MPVLLVLLYRTGVRPSLPRNLRFLAVALIAVQTANLLVLVGSEWRSGIFPEVGRIASLTYKSGLYVVLPGGHIWKAIYAVSAALHLAARFFPVLFLLALAKQAAPASDALASGPRLVKRAAVIAIVVRVLSMVISVLVYVAFANAVRTYAKAGSTSSTLLRGLLFGLPSLIVPWIIYRGIRKPQAAVSSCIDA
jgi:hypothetical protein